MSAGGEIATRGPGISLGDIPGDIQGEILKYLPPRQVIVTIQVVRSFRKCLGYLKVSELTVQQLVYLYQFVAMALKIESQREQDREDQPTNSDTITPDLPREPDRERPMPMTPDIRKKIIDRLPNAAREYIKANQTPGLEHNIFNCYYSDLKKISLLDGNALPPELRERIVKFIQEFHKKNNMVRQFCHKVAEIDPQGCRYRGTKPNPDKNAYISHLLFWLATDYISSNISSKKKTQEDVHRCLEEYIDSVDEIFGKDSETSWLFRESISEQGLFFLKYREIVSVCSGTYLNKIYRAVIDRGDEISQFKIYPTYMLSQGLDRALNFLDQHPEEIQLISDCDRESLLAWRNLFNDFEDPCYY